MLANTGAVSFTLYGILIIIMVSAMVFAFRVIKSETVDTDKLSKMIDLFKAIVLTTAISTVTLIVTDLFKERDQDLKEISYFDKYVADIKKADGVYERWQLARYFSIVAPSGEMKKSWKEYYQILDKEYQNLIVQKAKEASGTVTGKVSQGEYQRAVTEITLEKFDKPLVQSTEEAQPKR